MSRKKTVVYLILVLLLFGGSVYLERLEERSGASSGTTSRGEDSLVPLLQPGLADRDVVDRFRASETREREVDETVWADEMLARGRSHGDEETGDQYVARHFTVPARDGARPGARLPHRCGAGVRLTRAASGSG